jgi:Sulfotransferase family
MHGVLPNFFVVGAAKSGTTSIYRYLRQHPDVYMPIVKELHWFSRLEPNPRQGFHPITSEEEYLSLFEGWRGERAIGEASPSYLWDPKAPERIQRSVPSAKILILLREPVDRAFSHLPGGRTLRHPEKALLRGTPKRLRRTRQRVGKMPPLRGVGPLL